MTTTGPPIDFVSTRTPIDLTNCDREPIHIPGAVQPYGVLLALRAPELEIVQMSASAATLLGPSPDLVLGATIERALGAANGRAVRDMVADTTASSHCRLPESICAVQFEALMHRSEGLLLLELEPRLDDETLTPDHMVAVMRTAVQRLEEAETVLDLAQSVAQEMRRITGFDRVWVYRFHPDWHGEIIGEAKRDDIETWLGMHYPASDIPAQARALFLRHWVRVIPDIAFRPSPLIPERNPLTQQPLDLGGALLRSVSPIHVQYLKNMGVSASLVISLIHRGKLWGLISGHHYSGPKRVSYATRTLCEFLAQALSLQIGSTDRLDKSAYALGVRARQSALVEQIGAANALGSALTSGDVTLASVIGATGAMLVLGGERARSGETPDDPMLDGLLDWLRAGRGDAYVTSRLSADFPPAVEVREIVSGLIAIPLSRDRRDYLLWFRGEQRQAVRWAGDPRKPVTLDADGSQRLHPRRSFALWEEEGRGTATPWLPIEETAASDVRRAVLDLLIRRAEGVSALNDELTLTNMQLAESAAELEVQALELLEQREERDRALDRERKARAESDGANRAKADFLAVMSHELRTPLNAIGGYAQLLALGIRGPVTVDQSTDLERIQINQRHLLGLINGILNFTKLEAGQIQFALQRVAVEPMLRGLEALVDPQMRTKELAFVIEGCSSRIAVRADEEKLRQILLNLVTNALKFTEPRGRVMLACEQQGESAFITVSDSGRGIAGERLESVFEPFVQIDRHLLPVAEQGLGLGLAISRELARGMGGDLSATSTVGSGSSFTLMLPAAAPD